MTETNAAPSKSNATRRSVIRAGATAAWAVPAISVAAAVPAFAVSTSAVLSVTAKTLSFYRDTFTGTITFKNTGTVTSGVITVVFSNLATKVGTGGSYGAKTATAWSFGSGWTGTNGTAVSATGLAGGASTTLTFSATLPSGTAGSTTYGKLSFAAAIASPGTGTAGSWTDVLWAQPNLTVSGTPSYSSVGGVPTATIAFANTGGSPTSVVTVNVKDYQTGKKSLGTVTNAKWTLDSSSTSAWNTFSASTSPASTTSKNALPYDTPVTLKFTTTLGNPSDTHASFVFNADISNTAATPDVADRTLSF